MKNAKNKLVIVTKDGVYTFVEPIEVFTFGVKVKDLKHKKAPR